MVTAQKPVGEAVGDTSETSRRHCGKLSAWSRKAVGVVSGTCWRQLGNLSNKLWKPTGLVRKPVGVVSETCRRSDLDLSELFQKAVGDTSETCRSSYGFSVSIPNRLPEGLRQVLGGVPDGFPGPFRLVSGGFLTSFWNLYDSIPRPSRRLSERLSGAFPWSFRGLPVRFPGVFRVAPGWLP